MKLYTFDTRKQKKVLIGEIQGEALFKTVNPAKHFMRIVDGYGIQYQAFQELKAKQIKKIIIKETTGNQWEATLQTWIDNSKVADYGSGKQVFMSLKFMNSKRKIKPEPFTPTNYEPLVKPKPINAQEKLF